MERWPLLIAGLLAVGCAGGGGADTERAPADSAALPADSVPADTASADTASDPFAGFQLESGSHATSEPRRLSLSLRNDGPMPAIVRASGGADEVLLDTVPPTATHRVDVLTRAASVTLRSLGEDGRTLRTIDVAAGPDTVVEVRVDGASP